ncbi:hypothetical protein ASPBRDRAFT_134084 [Aspergillus brasiliensis CBS 101740]|uniref:Protein kinase domain-containing protein n=1 Tax=Aspergillus brasiliensis (strain CBS 101740 / IMI 381727 / IBT 21946) TaxID=767769 RepID=A0A1L9U8W5_ASPBC|nr:hypothetical protein ASPBRDRAFT_134084 [Aspergillus brasiliensis CBS 101740]
MDFFESDLAKPPIPYTKGWKFTVRSHITPAPTPVTLDGCRNFEHGREERAQLGPVARCCKNPPLPGDLGPDTVELEVLDPIRVGDGHSAQVFNVRILNPESNMQLFQGTSELVAKVFDPLYVDDHRGYLNPFLCEDRFYTHEAHTYRMLSDLQGGPIPRFYGSYSADIECRDIDDDPDANQSYLRTVRLILIEHIPGNSLLQVGPSGFTQQDRQQIMKSVIDFETHVYSTKDILLTDVCDRNVMMVPPGSRGGRRLVFLDFGGALFGRTLDEPILEGKEYFLGQYISPILRWKGNMILEWREWIDWEWADWVDSEYANTAHTITPEMRERYS